MGAIFLLAGGLKAMDPFGFARQIDSYGWLPAGLTAAAAFLFILLELLLGAGLVLDVRPRAMAGGATALLMLFVLVSADAWVRGTVVDCGCFGKLVQRGPGEVVVEDLLMLGLLLPSFLLGVGPRRARWRFGAAVATSLLGAGFALAAPHLPLDGLVTALVPGAELKEMGLDALVPEGGAVLVALLETETEASVHAVPGLNEIAATMPEVHVVGLAAAGPEERAMFGWTRGAGFPVEEVAGATLGTLARRLPRFALLVDGRVRAVWNEIPPDPGTLRTVLEGAST